MSDDDKHAVPDADADAAASRRRIERAEAALRVADIARDHLLVDGDPCWMWDDRKWRIVMHDYRHPRHED